MPEVVVMVTTSYPRFPGDSVGTFMEPIATSIAARGHEVHVVAPWHPLVSRRSVDGGVRFHFYKYAPVRALNVFGYAAAMRADVSLRAAAFMAAPLALAAGWRAARAVARRHRATIMHGHWVIPGGVTAAVAAPHLPLVISLHGSDVYVAERLRGARVAARAAFARAGFVTACSADLATRAIRLGADPSRIAVVPYGVDTLRFGPKPRAAGALRTQLGLPRDTPLVAAAGRLVRKKGFEYLIDALAHVPGAVVALAGDGTLAGELRSRARSNGTADRVHFMGDRSQDDVAALFAAADLVVAPSVRDDAGNVDGLPNVVMEALASGTALITTHAGGIGAVVEHERTAIVVPERDARALAAAITRGLADEAHRRRLGKAARELVQSRYGWERTAEQFESAYGHALAFKSKPR
ncbi:MAG TPA: glycosyltransferase family 4 protein [Vicinamibacterales bacterium]|nr:glycosyltransferase family 4 protein [Vicinamibacterales bacterium]